MRKGRFLSLILLWLLIISDLFAQEAASGKSNINIMFKDNKLSLRYARITLGELLADLSRALGIDYAVELKAEEQRLSIDFSDKTVLEAAELIKNKLGEKEYQIESLTSDLLENPGPYRINIFKLANNPEKFVVFKDGQRYIKIRRTLNNGKEIEFIEGQLSVVTGRSGQVLAKLAENYSCTYKYDEKEVKERRWRVFNVPASIDILEVAQELIKKEKVVEFAAPYGLGKMTAVLPLKKSEDDVARDVMAGLTELELKEIEKMGQEAGSKYLLEIRPNGGRIGEYQGRIFRYYEYRIFVGFKEGASYEDILDFADQYGLMVRGAAVTGRYGGSALKYEINFFIQGKQPFIISEKVKTDSLVKKAHFDSWVGTIP